MKKTLENNSISRINMLCLCR